MSYHKRKRQKASEPEALKPDSLTTWLIEPLNAQQETFWQCYVMNGGNGAKAAREALYKDHHDAARRLLADPRIMARIRMAGRKVLEVAQMRMGILTNAAFDALQRILDDLKSDPETVLTAVRLVMEVAKLLGKDSIIAATQINVNTDKPQVYSSAWLNQLPENGTRQ